MKNNKMLKNTIILFAALAITKLIGAVLKIPLTNIIGGLGMGYFSTAQSLFSPIYAVTAAAVPAVVMRLVAQNAAAGRYKDVRRLRRAGLLAAVGLGLCGSAGMFIIAAPFANYIAASHDSLLPILIIAPSLFFCSVSAVYKGYYEGLSNMLPTAISQIVEAVIKSSVGIVLAVMVLSHGGGAAQAAAAAIAGITISEFAGMVFLFLRGRFGKDGISDEALLASPPPQRKRVLIRTLLRESVPITIAALTMNLNPFIDMMTIPNIINTAVRDNARFFRSEIMFGNVGDVGNMGNFIYGSYTGITISIFALATTVTALVCKSALPEITAAWERKDTQTLNATLRRLFKGTFMVGLPVCLGIAALAQPILSLLYFTRPVEVMVSTPPLIILGVGGVPLLLAGTLFGIFLAIGRTDLQIKLMLGGAAIKLVGNIALVRIPALNISGAALATILCYSFVSIAGLIMLRKCLKPVESPRKLKLARHIAQPFIFAALCGITAYVCYFHIFDEYGISNINVSGSVMRLLTSVAGGAFVYLTLTFLGIVLERQGKHQRLPILKRSSDVRKHSA
jgi:stage V sporulation protein B